MAEPTKRFITFESLKAHNKPGDLWISIQGKVYDVSDWAKDHPGGYLPLLSLAGQDVTDAFVAYHPNTAWQYLDKFFNGYFIEDYSVSEVSKDYRMLVSEFSQMGLFEKKGHLALISFCFMALLFSVSVWGVLCCSSIWVHLVCGGLMGGLWIQSGWAGHDSGHYQIMPSKNLNRFVQILTGNCLAGISIAWWKWNHNAHHISCNSLDFDPDLQHMPFFVVSSKLFNSLTSCFYERKMPFDSVTRLFVSYQHWTFYPVMCFARLNLFAQSFMLLCSKRKVPNRVQEILGISVFWIWYPLLVSCLPNWGERLMFVLASFAVSGIQHVQFCLNHFSSIVYVGPPQESPSPPPMLGVSAMLGNSGHSAAAAAPGANGGGGGNGGEVGVIGPSSVGSSEEEKVRIEESERNSGGNRWPRQETLALLKIRSEMDVAFRDSSLKGPLWEEVSRKLAELGYHRNAKKCKEKFENVYKYHRRTKDGRSSKPDGKTYRFFDQLQALENQPPSLPLLPPPPMPQTHQAPPPPPPVAVAMPGTNTQLVSPPPVSTVPSTANPTITLTPNLNHSSNVLSSPPPQPVPSPPPPPPTTTTNLTNLSYNTPIPSSGPNMSMNIASISTSSSTSSDEEPERRCKRKRKWADFFQRLMSEVIEKQEEMQKKFLETLEKRERDRLAREEAWRVQEMERLNREHDLLIQERSMAASKDAAVIAYLQKISGQEVVPKVAAQLQTHLQTRPHDNPIMPPAAPPQPQPQQQQQQVQQQQLSPIQSQLSLQTLFKTPENPKTDNGGGNFTPVASSSRWPKAEVQALIQLRTNMDLKYQENGPKGPLWEEMSAAMRKLGYNRNAKRCKEKWENINKYFKKVKESNKKRPEDSKTCPYFHQLDALYREKAIAVKPENPMMVPIMVQPEQQWPLLEDHRRDQSAMEDHNDDNGHNEDEDDDEEDEDDEAGGYEIVANKPPSVGTDE